MAMQLIFITHHSLLSAHALAPLLSWILVAGAAYGALRFVIDTMRRLLRPLRNRRTKLKASA